MLKIIQRLFRTLRPDRGPESPVNAAAEPTAREDAPAQATRLDFDAIYRENTFGGQESHSGEGSSMDQTATVRRELPGVLEQLNVRAMLDIPCGDFNWMRHVELDGIHYTGGDVVEDLIRQCRDRFAGPDREFRRLDLIRDPLPACDLVFCRDCLVHLPFEDIFLAIANVKRSSARWFMTTTFTRREVNEELLGVWRTINLEIAPFSFPAPDLLLVENCPMIQGLDFSDKSLGVWAVERLPVPAGGPTEA
jgi:hypothetical protein